MPNEIENELRYLAKYLPEGLERCASKEVLDIYIPSTAVHPKIRIRRNGDKFMITKKEPITEGDLQRMLEQTIPLTEEEFNSFAKMEGKRLRKIRYLYDYQSRTADINVYKDSLDGLVIVDFEFDNAEDLASFKMPDFCLAKVNSEEFLAAGLLCGKSYSDIEEGLSRFNYKKIKL